MEDVKMELKLVISDPKKGFSGQKVVKDDAAKKFMGHKIGDKIRGELIDLTGYEFEITGGSDTAGFPMRKDIPGIGRKRILATRSVGLRLKGKGAVKRKLVSGNTIHEKIAQVNLKIIKEGKEAIPELTPKPKEAKEEKKE